MSRPTYLTGYCELERADGSIVRTVIDHQTTSKWLSDNFDRLGFTGYSIEAFK